MNGQHTLRFAGGSRTFCGVSEDFLVVMVVVGNRKMSDDANADADGIRKGQGICPADCHSGEHAKDFGA